MENSMKKLLLLLVIPALVAVTYAQSAEDDIAKLFNTASTSTTTTTSSNSTTSATPNTTTTPSAVTTTTSTDSNVYGAAELNLENTSYVNNNDGTYTLSWTAVAGSAKVEVSVKNNDLNEDFATVTKVNASDGKATITLNAAGNYTVKLLPVDETTWLPVGTEIRKTIKVDAKTTPTVTNNTPSTPSTPVSHPDKPTVWVEDNLLFGVVLLSIIGYMIYRFRKTN